MTMQTYFDDTSPYWDEWNGNPLFEEDDEELEENMEDELVLVPVLDSSYYF